MDGEPLQEYPVNAAVLQVPIRHPTLFLLYISAQPNNGICNISISADDILYSKCDQTSDLWQ